MKIYPKGSILTPDWHSTKRGYPKPINGQWCHIVVEYPFKDGDVTRKIMRGKFCTGYFHEGWGSNPDLFWTEFSVGIEMIPYEAVHEGDFKVLAWTPEVGIAFPEGME